MCNLFLERKEEGRGKLGREAGEGSKGRGSGEVEGGRNGGAHTCTEDSCTWEPIVVK